MSEEPELPNTPTNEGRKQKQNNFGYNVAFNQLWPLWTGIGGTVFFGVVFFLAGFQPFHWSVCLVLMLTPIAAGHYYIKKFIEGALPHYSEDFFAGLRALRPDWTRPAKKFVLWPSWRKELAMAALPPWHSGLQHPLVRLKKRFDKEQRK